MVNELSDMAKLAIKGHPTRGKEVIEIIGILGGSNTFEHIGNNPRAIYYIDETCKNFITCSETKKVCDCVIFTLEEFLVKYPYKVGDKVCIPDYESEVRITSMRWDGYNVQYEVVTDEVEWYSTEELNDFNEPRKEETMEQEISGAIIDRFICLEGYDFYDDKGNIIDTKEIIMKKKQPQYPKTYKECCEVLLLNSERVTWGIEGLEYKRHLIVCFQRLLICRDAYWRLAGNWKYDVNKTEECFYIVNKCGRIVKEHYMNFNHILAFPTEEMRDAFYENFKELIEVCKELL